MSLETTRNLSKVAARSRKNETQILQRISSIGQKSVADQAGISESKVSRMKDGEITCIAKLLSVLELKVVPVDMKCYRKESINAIFTLAQERLNSIDEPHEQLVWEDNS